MLALPPVREELKPTKKMFVFFVCFWFLLTTGFDVVIAALIRANRIIRNGFTSIFMVKGYIIEGFGKDRDSTVAPDI